MNILAIPATNSRNGLNRQLLGAAAQLLEGEIAPGATVEILDLNDYEMPIYSGEREREFGILEPAQRLYDKIGSADAVVISFAEHNGNYTAAWKNVFDWMSRIDMKVYQDKPVAMFAATPGPRSGAGVLGVATGGAPFFGADVVGSLGVGSFMQNFDPDAGQIADPELRAQFTEILASLTD